MKDNHEYTVAASELSKTGDATKTSFFKTRGFKYGSVATILTAVFIIAVISANLVFSILTDKYAWSFDLTSTDLYEVSDASKQIVNSLDPNTEIKITVFCAENKYPHYLAEPIKRFCTLSDKITCSYVDLEKNPTAATQYGTEYSITTFSVVVESGAGEDRRIRVFGANDYYEYDNDTGAISIFIEEKLASGVLYVTKEDIPVVYFVGGHGEDGYSALMNSIANSGAEVEEVNLATENIEFSPYSKLMVICNPARDYSESEIRKIEDFLNNGNKFGRNLMYFSSAKAFELPNLERMLEFWGIRYNDDIVYDEEKCYLQNANMVLPEYTTDELMNTGIKLSAVTSPLMTDSRSIHLLFEESDIYKTQEIFASSAETSYSRGADVVSDTVGKQATDKDGPHCLGALSMKYKFENNIQVQSYVFAAGSVEMIEASHLDYTANGELLMQLYKIMVNEKDDTILAAQKSKSSAVATITAPQMGAVAVVTLIVIPLIFLIIGAVVFIRRRFL